MHKKQEPEFTTEALLETLSCISSTMQINMHLLETDPETVRSYMKDYVMLLEGAIARIKGIPLEEVPALHTSYWE